MLFLARELRNLFGGSAHVYDGAIVEHGTPQGNAQEQEEGGGERSAGPTCSRSSV